MPRLLSRICTSSWRAEGTNYAIRLPANQVVHQVQVRLASSVAEISLSGRTVHRAAELLRNVLRRAVKWEVILRSPAASLDADDLPRAVKPESAVLTETEAQQLLQEAKYPTHRCTARHYLTAQSAFYPAVAFALYTRARLGEIMAMRWQDIDFRQRIVTIRRSLTRRSGRGYHWGSYEKIHRSFRVPRRP